MPRIVQGQPPFYPHVCCVTNSNAGEMIDFEAVPPCTEPPHIFIKKSIVENAAKTLCGMVKAEEVNTLRARMEDLSAELDETIERLQSIENFNEQFEEISKPLPERTALV